MILRCYLLLLIFFTPVVVQAADSRPSSSLTEQAHTSKLKVVATIRPIHSLLSFIMQGAAKPILLLDQTQSAHHYSLRPSQRSTLAHADILFWVGESLEGFMPRVINSLPKKVRVIELIETKGLNLLEPRSSHESASHHHGHHHGSIDPHIWLSTNNALVLAKNMAHTLIALDPTRQKLYNNNLEKLRTRLTKQKINIAKTFNKPDFKYLVYHDAFQYFEKQINVSPLIAISTDEEQAPGVRHLSRVNKTIVNNTINCLIYNTPTLPSIARNLIHNIPPIHIDPLGQKFSPDAELYFNLLNSLSEGFQQCQLVR